VQKILNIHQLRELDRYTIAHEPISSIDLMERACKAFVRWFTFHYDSAMKVAVVCGTGNNGGDGLGIARLLAGQGYRVAVWIVRGGQESEDFTTNFERLNDVLVPNDFETGMTTFPDCELLIDAVFGSGLTRPVTGAYEAAVHAMNRTDATRVAVDIPSGLFADQHSDGAIVKAAFTLTFQLPKLAFMMAENQDYVGTWKKLDIGLDKSFIRNATSSRFYMTRKTAGKILQPRGKFSHKGDFGHALLITGSRGKMGAAVLAARAALRAGVGLLTAHVPFGGNTILQSTVPEAMLSLDASESTISKIPELANYQAIGVGPGLGQSEETGRALVSAMEAGKPMVIDADALNLISSHREWLHLIPPGSILTPHPKEFERLAGPWENEFERLKKQEDLARKLKCVVLIKGAHTAIATPAGDVTFNSTGNPGMATGGSGDVLTGVLTSLLAQGYPAIDAALLGVYLHGFAGDLAAREMGEHSLMAGDLTDFLPAAFRSLV